jgi:hypothetical protein
MACGAAQAHPPASASQVAHRLRPTARYDRSYSSTAALSLNNNVPSIRVSLRLLTTDTFDIFDVWVMPYNFK